MRRDAIKRLETTQSVLELPQNYEAALVSVVSASETALQGLALWLPQYERRGKVDFEQFLKHHGQLVGDTLSDTSRKVNQIISTVPEILDGVSDFSREDRDVWQKARIRYPRTTNKPSVIANLEMNASSIKASSAMRAGLDDIVFGEARSRYPRTTNKPSVIANLEMNASSIKASSAMEDELFKIYPKTETRGNSYSDYRTNFDDLFGTHTGPRPGGNGNGRQQQDRQTTPPPRTEAPEKDSYDEVMDKLRLGVDQSIYTTMQSFERAAVKKVIATVKYLRESNPEITDREIAVRYCRLSNNTQHAAPQRVESTKIIMTLMGGKISGTLPF